MHCLIFVIWIIFLSIFFRGTAFIASLEEMPLFQTSLASPTLNDSKLAHWKFESLEKYPYQTKLDNCKTWTNNIPTWTLIHPMNLLVGLIPSTWKYLCDTTGHWNSFLMNCVHFGIISRLWILTSLHRRAVSYFLSWNDCPSFSSYFLAH